MKALDTVLKTACTAAALIGAIGVLAMQPAHGWTRRLPCAIHKARNRSRSSTRRRVT